MLTLSIELRYEKHVYEYITGICALHQKKYTGKRNKRKEMKKLIAYKKKKKMH